MKTSRIGLATTVLIILALLVPLSPPARGAITSTRWTSPTFNGFDPFFAATVDAYTAGGAATLLTIVTDSVTGRYINLTSWKLSMDWNQNYTGSISQQILSSQQAPVTITFTVPQTSTASNLVIHNGAAFCGGACLAINYTTASGTKNQQFFSSIPDIAVYSTDQASAMSAAQQLSALQALTSAGANPCSGFKTPQASSSCYQALQQSSLGLQLYKTGNFAGANTALQNALTNWNNAINNENSAGAGLTLGSTVGGWGSLLLGIGAVIVGAAAIIYSIRRPKELRAAAASR